MDRFKFRAFSKAENKMIHFGGFMVGFDEKGDAVVMCKDYNFGGRVSLSGYSDPMQCTGLRDKNGVLIYEGDVLNSEYCDKPCVVHYGIGTFDGMHYKYTGFFLVRVGDHPVVDQVEDTDFGGGEFSQWYEVIGNIYENKELLNEPS